MKLFWNKSRNIPKSALYFFISIKKKLWFHTSAISGLRVVHINIRVDRNQVIHHGKVGKN